MIEGYDQQRRARNWSQRWVGRVERAAAAAGRALGRARKRWAGQRLTILTRIDWRLGDEIIALPVYEALKRQDPTAYLVARVRHPELLVGNPFVDAINPPKVRPDRILDLQGEVAGEPRRLTLARRARVGLDPIRPRVYLSERERIEPPLIDLAELGGPRVVVHPTSTQPCKSWSPGHWQGLVSSLVDDGAVVVQIGQQGPDLDRVVDLRGRTGVRQLARVVSQADLVVSEDSGPLHLALAVGTPAVGLFGPTVPELLYPDDSGLEALVSEAECRGCWPRRTLAYPSGMCPLERHECMEAIPPGAVLTRVRALIRRFEARR